MRADHSRSSRTGRSPEVLDRIRRSHERVKARRDAARLQEQIILAAVKRYIDAWQAIRARESKRDGDLEKLRHRITEVEAEAAAEIDRHRVTQAGVAATLRERGQSDDQIADLLEITAKEARRLLGLARTIGEATTVPPDPVLGSRRRRQRKGIPIPAAPSAETESQVGTRPDVANRDEPPGEG